MGEDGSGVSSLLADRRFQPERTMLTRRITAPVNVVQATMSLAHEPMSFVAASMRVAARSRRLLAEPFVMPAILMPT